mgnify:FL=1
MSVTMTLEDDIDVSRGDMIIKTQNEPVVTQDLQVLITWMSERSLRTRTKVFLKHTTNECLAMVKAIDYKVDINTLEQDASADSLQMNDIAKISLRASKVLFLDDYATNRLTGSVILIDEQTNETIGAGMIINTK